MSYEIAIAGQGFLLPPGSGVPSDSPHPMALVVPGLTVGAPYALVRVAGSPTEALVVFSFDSDEDRALAAAVPAIAARFPDKTIIHGQGLTCKAGIIRVRVTSARSAALAVAAVSAAAYDSMPSSASRVLVELGSATYAARPVHMNGGYRIEVERVEHEEVAPEAPPAKVPSPRAATTIATLERVTATLSKKFADPAAGALYRAALRDLGVAYRAAGDEEKGMAALQLCESLFGLVLVPADGDRQLRERVALDLRGAPGPDIDESRWLRYLDSLDG